MPGEQWNGAGAHCNYSTLKMRQKGGRKVINKAIEKLKAKHDWHIKQYDPNGGADNERRLTGANETSSIETFSSGTADRTASVRIPRSVAEEDCGYLEDRRPSSNCDPYLVTAAIVQTTILDDLERYDRSNQKSKSMPAVTNKKQQQLEATEV